MVLHNVKSRGARWRTSRRSAVPPTRWELSSLLLVRCTHSKTRAFTPAMDGDVVVLLFRDTADAGTPLASGKEGMTVSPLNVPLLFLVSIRNASTHRRGVLLAFLLLRFSKIMMCGKNMFLTSDALPSVFSFTNYCKEDYLRQWFLPSVIWVCSCSCSFTFNGLGSAGGWWLACATCSIYSILLNHIVKRMTKW